MQFKTFQFKLLLGFMASFSICLSACKTRNFEGQVNTAPQKKVVFASEEQLSKFFELKNWPRYKDYEEHFGGIPVNFSGESRFSDLSFEQAAELIVVLEKFYPGANFACIGRDVTLACDILELFYKNVSKKQKVTVIGVSSYSFFNHNSSFQTLFQISKKLLLSSGFNPKLYSSKESNESPFVLLDATSYRARSEADTSMSQLRLLLKAAYSLVKENGGDPEKIAQLVNAFSLKLTPEKTSLLYGVNSQQKKSEVAEALMNGFYTLHQYPGMILAKNFESLSYGDFFWHSTFEALEEDKDGRVFAQPGMGTIVGKREVYNRTVALQKFLISGSFAEKLKRQAKEWGVPSLENFALVEPL